MSFLRSLVLTSIACTACSGPTLNLGDSDAAGGNGNVSPPTANANSAGGNGLASGANGVGGSGDGSGSVGGTGSANAGASGSVTALPIPTVEVLSEPGYSGLQAVYVGTDDSVWVGAENGIHLYANGVWLDSVERPGEDIGQLWGEGPRPIFASGRRAVYEYTDGSWRSIATLDCPAFLKLSVTQGFVYAACNAANQSVVRVARTTSATEELAPSLTYATRALWPVSDAAVYAWIDAPDSQGSPGYFQVFSGGTWNSAASWRKEELARTGNPQHLNAMWSFDGAALLFVGNGGTVLRRKQGTWSADTTPNTETLTAAWGSAEDGEFAVGSFGTILFHDRTKWHVVASPSTASLTAIHGQRNGSIVAVGESTTVLRLVN